MLEWNLVGLFSPGVAVIGDVLFALVLAWGVITPVRLGWRVLTRPVERRAGRVYWSRPIRDNRRDGSTAWSILAERPSALRVAAQPSPARQR